MAIEAKQSVTFTNVTLNGTISGTSVVESSAGAGDSGSIVTLNASGKWDTSVIPPTLDFGIFTIYSGVSLDTRFMVGGFDGGDSSVELRTSAPTTWILKHISSTGVLLLTEEINGDVLSIADEAGSDIDLLRPLDLNANPIKGIDDLTVNEVAAPGTPAAGKVAVYAKTDGKLYIKDDAGTETDLTSGGGGSTDAQIGARVALRA